ncbi:hypothetical protein EV426DRAFT_126133 [Tirmania nivea]|nr:hypothetical protein EV426DRAFT_126133 [Tirmania nivea]
MHDELFQLMPRLPPVSSIMEYALQCFPSSQFTCDYIKITETSLCPPDVDPILENYVATYVNNTISNLVTIIDGLASEYLILVNIQEGYFNLVWASFIDALWRSGSKSGLYLACKELLSYIPGLSYRFDGLFRYIGHVDSFDVGVAEASKPAGNVNNDRKGDNDFAKIHVPWLVC